MLFKSLNQIFSSSSSSSNKIVVSNESNIQTSSLFELNSTAGTNKYYNTCFSRPMMINY